MDNTNLNVRIETLKKTIADAVNSSDLHPFILDSIFKDFYNEVHIMYVNKLNEDIQEYNSQKESEENKDAKK